VKMQLCGISTGILFGFLLQKGRVLRYDRQLGALRLLDMTIIKFMLSSIMVGMVGVYLLTDLGLAELSVRPTILGPLITGGLIFGIGWGLVGFCPGTAVAALGEGRWDAAWGIAGMLVGGALYAEDYPAIKTTLLTWGDYDEITLPQLVGVNHWVAIICFIGGGLLLFRWFEKKGL
jgi:uncharacterized membrane protein YedE/YeeE